MRPTGRDVILRSDRNAVDGILVFFVCMIGLLGTFLLCVGGLTCLVVTLAERRLPPVRLPVGALCGYLARPSFVWSLVPRDWTLAFWTTLAATVNTERYGHTVEHAAEGIVIWMLFAGVTGALIGGFAARQVRSFDLLRRI